MSRPPIPVEQRIASSYVVDASGCWLWHLRIAANGYGLFEVRQPTRKAHVAHRFVYELLVGPIPDGLVLDHLCRVRNCVNPQHLEPVTQAENLRRSRQALGPRTECRRGHPLTADNVYRQKRPNGVKQVCLLCRREIDRRRRTRQREAWLTSMQESA